MFWALVVLEVATLTTSDEIWLGILHQGAVVFFSSFLVVVVISQKVNGAGLLPK